MSNLPEIGKNWRYFDDIFSKTNGVSEKATTLNTTCTIWNMIINSFEIFQGLSQGLQFKGSYFGSSVIGFSLGSSVIEYSLGSWILGMPYQVSKYNF